MFGSFGVGPARPGGQPTAQEFHYDIIKMSVFIFLDWSEAAVGPGAADRWGHRKW